MISVSHAWAYNFVGLGILERKYEGKENEIFIWMDIFSVKQPPNLTDPSWFKKDCMI